MESIKYPLRHLNTFYQQQSSFLVKKKARTEARNGGQRRETGRKDEGKGEDRVRKEGEQKMEI